MEKLSLILANIAEQIINNYSDDIANLVLGALVLGIGYLINHTKNGFILKGLQAVEKAVYVVKQQTVDDLKAKSADGKLTPEERAQAKANFIAVCKQELGIVGRFFLSLIVGDLEKWLSTQADFIIAKIKEASNSRDNK